MKVVIHVGNASQWDTAVKNSNNLKAVEADAVIEIVVNAGGVTLFRKPDAPLLEQMSSLAAIDTPVKLCRNALVADDIQESSLPDGAQVVPAGIVELIQRQEEGYAYISP